MRDYSKLDLPVVIPRWKFNLAGGIEKIRPFWDLLPATVAEKILAVYNGSESALIITKEDLDSLSNAAWHELERNL